MQWILLNNFQIARLKYDHTEIRKKGQSLNVFYQGSAETNV